VIIIVWGRLPSVFSLTRKVANKNTHHYHDGHLKSFKNSQASLGFSQALSRGVFLSVMEKRRLPSVFSWAPF
jgi:hypothetical protein